MEQQDYLSPVPNQNSQQNLPNATASLVLGIISIVGVLCYGVGLICGIIGLILANKDRRMYKEFAEMYSPASYGTSNAGRICCIIGIILFCLVILLFVLLFFLSAYAFPHFFK